MRLSLAAPIAAIFLMAAALSAPAHEGHDHGATPALTISSTGPRAEATSELYELVAISDGPELVMYLDRTETNAPVEGAIIEIETPAGPAAAVESGGTYRISAPWALRPGRHDLIFTVTVAGNADLLTATLAVPERASLTKGSERAAYLSRSGMVDDLRNVAGGRLTLSMAAALGFAAGGLFTWLLRRRKPAGGVAVLAVLAIILTFGPAAVAHEGGEHGDLPAAPATSDLAQRLPDGSVFVPKPTQRILALRTIVTAPTAHQRTVELPGRIIPDPNASGYVQAAVSGRLSPPATGFRQLGAPVRKGEALAYVTPPLSAAETSNQRQRQSELDQQIGIIEQRIARSEKLLRSGAVAQVQVDEARMELKGLQDRRGALERGRREPEALLAPVDGVIAAANAVAGQIAEPNAIVFQIIDPARLWVEALSFEAVVFASRADARTAEGRNFQLEFRGSGFSDRSQSVPVHFSIKGGATGLRLGQLLTVLAETNDKQDGLAVPRTSVLRGSNGQSIIYEHTTAERFEPREVRIEPLDGDRVFIAAGIGPGKRVVTQGAELLNQVR